MTKRAPGIWARWAVAGWIAVLAALPLHAATHFEQPLRVRGDRDFPPYEFLDAADRPAGFNVDLFQAVAEVMGLHTEIKLGVWAQVRQEVGEGRADVLMGMFRSTERAQSFDFSMPHSIVSYCLFARQGTPVGNMGELAGKVILVEQGDVADDIARHLTELGGIQHFDSPLQVLRALAEGQGDAALLPRLQGLYLCGEHRLQGIRAVGPPLQPQEYCFAVSEGNPALVGLLNEGLAIVQHNGTYDRIHQQWFGIRSPGFWQRSEVRYVVYAMVGIILLLVVLIARGARLARELRRKQRALVETEARWHLALEGSGLGVFDWDVAQDHLVYSPQYHRLLGYEPGTLGGGIAQWRERVHPDELPASQASLDRHLRGEAPFYESEYRMRGANGAYRWYMARGKVLARTPDGQPLRHLGILADITDRKLIELQLQHSRDLLEQRVQERTTELSKRVTEAEQINRAMANVMQDLQGTNRKLTEMSGTLAERNRELDAFAHSVSHDLRAPLRAIDGFTGIIEEEYGDKLDSEGRRLLGIVRESAQRMTQLIADLLAFSRLGRQPLHAEEVSIQDMVADALGNVQRKADGQVAFSVGNLPTAYGDRGMLQQAFANLIDNAVKFSAAKAEPRITIDGTSEEEGVHYWIRDNGIGFEPKYANRIFQVFERLHPPERYPGTGVGLSLVQRIVQRHGGTIWAEAEPETGATFHIRLPGRKIEAAK